jgi:hypothetical protein
MTKIHIQHQDQVGAWKTTQQNTIKVMRIALPPIVRSQQGNAIALWTRMETCWIS